MENKSDKRHIRFREFQPLACWKVGLSYGSMIYFEMQDKIFEKGLSSEVGSAALWINADEWIIYHNEREVSDSETIVESDISLLNKLFLGKKFLKIEDKKKENIIEIFFGKTIVIKISKPQDEFYDLLTFFLPDGGIYYYSDAFYKSSQIDKTRYAAWIQKKQKQEHKHPKTFKESDFSEAFL